MSSNIDFIDVNSEQILSDILTQLENGVQEPLYPGDERRIFAEAALAPMFVSLFNLVNDACRQKLLRYARGEVLDALGENRSCERILAQKATTTLRFSIDSALSQNIIIPRGVRVTSDNQRYFETETTVVLPEGFLSVDVRGIAVEGGAEFNNIPVGAINKIVDTSQCPLIDNVTNLDATTGGADAEDDNAYRERIRTIDSAYSTAGPAPAYRYWAIAADPVRIADAYVSIPENDLDFELQILDTGSEKIAVLGGFNFLTESLVVKPHGGSSAAELNADYTVDFDEETEIIKIGIITGGILDSETIIDVSITKQEAGTVQIVPMGYGGELPDEDMLEKVLESCTQDNIKPLTDKVVVKEPDVVSFDIELVYYTTDADESQCVETVEGEGGAIYRYAYWQGSSLNRDLNPDYLRKLILAPDWDGAVAATKVDIVSPVYQDLPVTTIAKWSGIARVSHVVKEGVV